jgi:cytochrome oxidase Cu insertion factor (SCO1/SenC/PrrC family)
MAILQTFTFDEKSVKELGFLAQTLGLKKSVILRHLIEEKYRVVSMGYLPCPHDCEPVPLVVVAPEK